MKRVLTYILIALVALVMLGPRAVAQTQIPNGYTELQKLYSAALDRIVELESGIQQAILLAQGYRGDWADQKDLTLAEKALREKAEASVTTLLELIRQMGTTMNKQSDIIMQLTSPKRFSFTAGVTLDLGRDLTIDPRFTVAMVFNP